MKGVLGESPWNSPEEVVVHEGDGRLEATVLASAAIDLLGPRRSGSLRRSSGCETIYEEEGEGKDMEAGNARASCSRSSGAAEACEASREPAFPRARHRRSLTDSAVAAAAAAAVRPTRHRRTRSIYGLEGLALGLACEAAQAAASPKAAASPRALASPRAAHRCAAFRPATGLPSGQLCLT